MRKIAIDVRNTGQNIVDSLRFVRGPFVAIAGCFIFGTISGALVYSPSRNAASAGAELFSVAEPSTLTFATQNLTVAAVLLSGAVLLGLPTLVTTIINGIILGIIWSDLIGQGVTPSEIALLLVPHGIFEIPGLLLVGAVGLSAPRGLISYLRGERDRILTETEVRKYVRVVCVGVALILLAAWIEANVTGSLYLQLR